MSLPLDINKKLIKNEYVSNDNDVKDEIILPAPSQNIKKIKKSLNAKVYDKVEKISNKKKRKTNNNKKNVDLVNVKLKKNIELKEKLDNNKIGVVKKKIDKKSDLKTDFKINDKSKLLDKFIDDQKAIIYKNPNYNNNDFDKNINKFINDTGVYLTEGEKFDIYSSITLNKTENVDLIKTKKMHTLISLIDELYTLIDYATKNKLLINVYNDKDKYFYQNTNNNINLLHDKILNYTLNDLSLDYKIHKVVYDLNIDIYKINSKENYFTNYVLNINDNNDYKKYKEIFDTLDDFYKKFKNYYLLSLEIYNTNSTNIEQIFDKRALDGIYKTKIYKEYKYNNELEMKKIFLDSYTINNTMYKKIYTAVINCRDKKDKILNIFNDLFKYFPAFNYYITTYNFNNLDKVNKIFVKYNIDIVKMFYNHVILPIHDKKERYTYSVGGVDNKDYYDATSLLTQNLKPDIIIETQFNKWVTCLALFYEHFDDDVKEIIDDIDNYDIFNYYDSMYIMNKEFMYNFVGVYILDKIIEGVDSTIIYNYKFPTLKKDKKNTFLLSIDEYLEYIEKILQFRVVFNSSISYKTLIKKIEALDEELNKNYDENKDKDLSILNKALNDITNALNQTINDINDLLSHLSLNSNDPIKDCITALIKNKINPENYINNKYTAESLNEMVIKYNDLIATLPPPPPSTPPPTPLPTPSTPLPTPSTPPPSGSGYYNYSKKYIVKLNEVRQKIRRL